MNSAFTLSIAILGLWACLAVVNCQEGTAAADPTGADVQLLVRKVDESHPYFVSMNFRKPQNETDSLGALKRMLATHCNTSNITRLVKNDLLLLTTSDDVNALVSGDRIEVWSNSSGPATRAATMNSSASSQMQQPMCKLNSAANSDGKGRGKGDRKRRGEREEEEEEDRFKF